MQPESQRNCFQNGQFFVSTSSSYSISDSPHFQHYPTLSYRWPYTIFLNVLPVPPIFPLISSIGLVRLSQQRFLTENNETKQSLDNRLRTIYVLQPNSIEHCVVGKSHTCSNVRCTLLVSQESLGVCQYK